MTVNYFTDSSLRLTSWYFFLKEINIKITTYVIIFHKLQILFKSLVIFQKEKKIKLDQLLFNF